MNRRIALAGLPFTLAWPRASARPQAVPLPVMGVAPPFELTDQSGAALTLGALRGKVVALTFLFTTCSSSCPTLTATMAAIAQQLGADFGRRVHFVSVTVDPLNDTPEQLRRYAARFGADGPGWSFLTGALARIDTVVAAYGGFALRRGEGPLEHAFLTSLVDRRGRLRVQYVGTRFSIDEMLGDLRSLMREA